MLRRLIALALTGAVFLTSSLGMEAVASSNTEVDVWVADWRENVFQDTEKPEEAVTKASLTAARNDIEPFQVNVRAPVDGKIINVAFSDLICGENSIAAANMTYHCVEHVRSRTNSRYADAADPDAELGDWDTKWVNLSNPMRKVSEDDIAAWPEILSNSQSRTISAGKTQPIWIKAHIPAETVPGTYSGWMQIRTDLGNFDVDIIVEVMDVTIPESSSADAFSLEIWSQLVGNFDTAVDVIVDAYDVEVDSPEWWEIMGNFAQLMKENRLNVLAVNQTQLLLRGPDTTAAEDGTVTFDWSFFNKFVQFFLDNGGIQ